METLDNIIQLDEDDITELCNDIKEFLSKQNKKFSYSNKGKLKSEIAKEKEKYHKYLLNIVGSPTSANTSMGSMIVTKEERAALQTLIACIQHYTKLHAAADECVQEFSSQKLTVLASISQISKQIETIATNIGEIAFQKYLTFHKDTALSIYLYT